MNMKHGRVGSPMSDPQYASSLPEQVPTSFDDEGNEILVHESQVSLDYE